MVDVIMVGTVALDSVKTPFGEVEETLGGSAVYASVAASLFAKVGLVGVIGKDFPKKHLEFSKEEGHRPGGPGDRGRRHVPLEGLLRVRHEPGAHARHPAERAVPVQPEAAEGVPRCAVRLSGQHRPGDPAERLQPDPQAEAGHAGHHELLDRQQERSAEEDHREGRRDADQRRRGPAVLRHAQPGQGGSGVPRRWGRRP